MGLFGKGPGILNVIRCDLDDYLIWKWKPAGNDPKSLERANSIRGGSSLRVKEGAVAVFVYTQNNGTAQDYIEGPKDIIIDTENLPVLSTLIGKAYNGSSPFQAEVYFINLAGLIQIKFGIPYFDVFDPRFIEFGVPTAVRGSVSFHITDYKQFIRLHPLNDFNIAQFQDQVRDTIVRYTKQIVGDAPDQFGIPVVQMERRISELSDIIKSELDRTLKTDFAVTVSRVDLSAIELNKNSEGYKKLSSITQNKAAAFVQSAGAASSAASAVRSGQNRILQTRKETLTNSGSNGFDLGQMGKQISDSINSLFGGLFKAAPVPPPVPTVQYHVAVNGESSGPFTIDELKEMKKQGKFDKDCLVWNSSMKEWKTAGSVSELASVFEGGTVIPPEIPQM